MERVAEAIARACANSPFLAGLMDRNADLMPLIHAGDFDTALANALARHQAQLQQCLHKAGLAGPAGRGDDEEIAGIFHGSFSSYSMF